MMGVRPISENSPDANTLGQLSFRRAYYQNSQATDALKYTAYDRSDYPYFQAAKRLGLRSDRLQHLPDGTEIYKEVRFVANDGSIKIRQTWMDDRVTWHPSLPERDGETTKFGPITISRGGGSQSFGNTGGE